MTCGRNRKIVKDYFFFAKGAGLLNVAEAGGRIKEVGTCLFQAGSTCVWQRSAIFWAPGLPH